MGIDQGVQDLWRRYRATRDVSSRDQLVRHYWYLLEFHAKKLASRVPGNITMDDLVSAGSVALLDLLDSFDLARGLKFETYAALRLKGAMLDELRQIDWVPRVTRQFVNKVAGWSRIFYQDHGRGPSDLEVAQAFGVSSQEIQEARTMVSVVRMDHWFDSNQRDGGNLVIQDFRALDPADQAVRVDALERFEGSLSERVREIAALRFREGLTMLEIAGRVGLSESRVSQLLGRVAQKFGMRHFDTNGFHSRGRPPSPPSILVGPGGSLRRLAARLRRAAEALELAAREVLAAW